MSGYFTGWAAGVLVLRAGAAMERILESSERGSAAFCSDPFGYGFCLIESCSPHSEPQTGK
jgi:hypothetical protein